jgi:hypothetical protein
VEYDLILFILITVGFQLYFYVIICVMIFRHTHYGISDKDNNVSFGAIAFYEGNNMLSALAKYVINRLIHGLFDIAIVISPRLISSSLEADIKVSCV